MSHDHHHHIPSNSRVLFWSFLFIFSFMIIEVVGGFLFNSLALLSDAGHMLSDAAALGLSLLAFKIGEKSVSNSKTYGYRRFEIIAAFINGLTLIVISLFISYEAINRFIEPPEVNAGMMVVASIGLVVNIIVAFMLMRGDSKENLNIRSALLHVFGDLLGSVGAIAAGLLILLFDLNIADPIASMIVAILIAVSGFRVTRDALHILMEGKPDTIKVEQVETALINLDGVTGVHDLHIWSITSEFPALSCHIVVEEDIERDQLLQEAIRLLEQQFNITHATIQVEGLYSRLYNECQPCE
ncbi:cation diffusion facilitator family transporter [Virgibacillus xinjiangensis]|uniref:Cation diffusion facilitator family transporter n=1 Tax=Virgibacillus xinjiangensis TaxID=393090 RepID=A0ABV7CQF3_9BACI